MAKYMFMIHVPMLPDLAVAGHFVAKTLSPPCWLFLSPNFFISEHFIPGIFVPRSRSGDEISPGTKNSGPKFLATKCPAISFNAQIRRSPFNLRGFLLNYFGGVFDLQFG